MYHSPEPLSKLGGWLGQSPATGIFSRRETSIYPLLFIDGAPREYISQHPGAPTRTRHEGSVRALSVTGCRVASIVNPFTGMQLPVQVHVLREPQPIMRDNATVR